MTTTTMPAEGGWDVHTHVIPSAVLDAARMGYLGLAVDGAALLIDGHRTSIGRLTDATALAAWVGANALDGAIVSPPPPLYRPHLEASHRERWVQLLNDGIAETCSTKSKRLRPLAYLPTDCPVRAAEIAADLEDSWAGVVLSTDLGHHVYSETAYYALWEVLASQRLPVFVHPGHCADVRLESFYLRNLLGNPYETTVAAAHLVFGGTLERFPSLQVVLAHGGGALAALAGRWQRGYDTERPGVPRLELSPIEAVRRFYVDTLAHHPAALNLTKELLSAERLLIGSDWPFPMGADSVDDMLRTLTDKEARAVRVDNPRRCFGARLGCK